MSLLQPKVLPSAVPTPEIAPSPPFGLVTLRQYQAQNTGAFPSFESLRWFVRQHRQALAEAGALLKWRGEFVVDVPKFEAAAKTAMQTAAVTKLGMPYRGVAR